MQITRRQFAATSVAATYIARAAGLKGLKIGVTDWNLRQTGKLEAVVMAKSLGFEGVQISLGRNAAEGKLPLDNPESISAYLAESKKQSIPLDGTCLDILHVNGLKSGKLGQKWVSDGIRVTKALGIKVMLLPFFGKWALTNRQEVEYVGDVLKDLGPEAEKAGVILGLEDTVSAEDNVRMMERSASKAVLTYYDIGNSHRAGFDVPREIEWLGRKRICQMHFKDNPGYLGEGPINFPAAMASVSRIGWEGYANLETDSPSKDVQNDMRRNLAYVKKVLAQTRET